MRIRFDGALDLRKYGISVLKNDAFMYACAKERWNTYDDDEVRRVSKTPDDPCRCTRQYL